MNIFLIFVSLHMQGLLTNLENNNEFFHFPLSLPYLYVFTLCRNQISPKLIFLGYLHQNYHIIHSKGDN